AGLTGSPSIRITGFIAADPHVLRLPSEKTMPRELPRGARVLCVPPRRPPQGPPVPARVVDRTVLAFSAAHPDNRCADLLREMRDREESHRTTECWCEFHPPCIRQERAACVRSPALACPPTRSAWRASDRTRAARSSPGKCPNRAVPRDRPAPPDA